MDIASATSYMARHMSAIAALSEGLTEEECRWRPTADEWSVLEVVNHLLDEEREDFKVRLDYILHRPGEPWPEIDPQGWVLERDYNSRELVHSLRELVAEREASIERLGSLGDTRLDIAAEAPWGGEISAGDMLTAWVAHDVLHLRQLTELRYALISHSWAPYSPEYAGDW